MKRMYRLFLVLGLLVLSIGLLPGNPLPVSAQTGASGTHNAVPAPGAVIRQPAQLAGSTGTWALTAPMPGPRYGHWMALLPDGRVLVTGGCNANPCTLLTSTWIYNPALNNWSTVGSLNTARLNTSTLVTLQNGKLLLTGGADITGYNDIASTEIFDPATGLWTYSGNLNTSRRGIFPIALADGRVLIGGGAHGLPDGNRFLATTEIYNPTSGVWSYSGNLNIARDGLQTIVLQDGRVMGIGGEGPWYVRNNHTDIFNPTTGAWTLGGDAPVIPYSLTMLNDGKVLGAGGWDGTNFFANASLFNPATNTWSATGALNFKRNGQISAKLPSGEVMVAGGDNGVGTPLASTEIYSPTTGTWRVDTPMSTPRTGFNSVQFADGRVMACGGAQYDLSTILSSCEIYTSAALEPAADLYPYTPNGWTGAIIATANQDSTKSGPLYSDRTTFLNFAILNAGPSVSSFQACIFLDGVQQFCENVTDLPVGYYDYFSNYTFQSTPTPGPHTVRVVATPVNPSLDPIPGNNAYETSFTWLPAPVTTKLTTGFDHTCRIDASGWAWCTGSNQNGELGLGDTNNRMILTQLGNPAGHLVSISSSGRHTCALTDAGGMKCWGDSGSGQLGDGKVLDSLTALDVSGLTSGVVSIAAGGNFTCALTSTGGVKCWGANNYGQLGDTTLTQRSLPGDVSGLSSGVSAIYAGFEHACALLFDGSVKCWGKNNAGQVGVGSYTAQNSPKLVSGLPAGVIGLALGDRHTCVLTTTGYVTCWGSNQFGQLGDDTVNAVTGRTSPGPVLSNIGGAVKSVSTGWNHTCAVTTAGGVKCWGNNETGQIGDASGANQPLPKQVFGLTSGAATTSSGWGHNCVSMDSGTLKCWGNGIYGQLGMGSLGYATKPVDMRDTIPVYTISGKVIANSAVLEGVVVTDGAGHSGTTDAQGMYAIAGLVPGAYTLTPAKSGYTFTPANRQVTITTGDIDMMDFLGNPVSVIMTVMGTVRDSSGAPISGATVSAGPGKSATTNDQGAYQLDLSSPGTYTLTPSKGDYTFTPVNRAITLPTQNRSNLDFTGTPPNPVTPITLRVDPGLNRMQLTWDPYAGADLSGYRISRATPNATSTFSEIGTASEPRYFDTSNLTAGQNYCYKVEAMAGQVVRSSSQAVCAIAGQVSMWVPDTYALPGGTVIVPVNIRNATGLNIAAADIWLNYNPAVLECQKVDSTAMTVQFSWMTNINNTAGQVKISTISSPTKTIYGDGSLFWLTFRVKGSTGSSSPLDLKEFIQGTGGSTLNVETAPGNAISVPLLLSDGQLQVQAQGMLGDVNDDGVVSSIDAYQALQIAVGNQAATVKQKYSADVNGDGIISSADVTMILYYAVNNQWPLPGNAKAPALFQAQSAATLALSSATGKAGEEVTLSLSAQNLTDWAGGDWVINYDPNVIADIVGVSAGSFAPNATLAFHEDSAGQLKVSLAGKAPVSGSGELLKITLKLASQLDKHASPVLFAEAHLNDPYGRDFVLSALQGTITTSNGSVQVMNYLVYLPSLKR